MLLFPRSYFLWILIQRNKLCKFILLGKLAVIDVDDEAPITDVDVSAGVNDAAVAKVVFVAGLAVIGSC